MRPRSATAPTARATLHVRSALACVWPEVGLNVRNSSEHALVDTEQEIGNTRASDRGRAQHVHQAKVIQGANVLSSLVRKG